MEILSPRRDDGAAAVEFALVVPLLLLVVFGIINFGVLMSQQLTLNNAVRSGARVGVVAGAALDCPAIRAKVGGDLSGLAIDTSQVQVRITLLTPSGSVVTTPCGSSSVAVTDSTSGSGGYPCAGTTAGSNLVVEGRYVSDVPVSFPPFPTTITLSAKGVFVCEFS